MKKNSSILSKVSKQALLLSLLSIAVITVVFAFGIGFLRQNTLTTSTKLGNSAAEDSKSAMETQTLQQLQTLAMGKAALSDEKLDELQNYIKMLSDNATKVMSSPEKYLPAPIISNTQTASGKYIIQLLHSEDTTAASLKSETDLIGNNTNLMLNIAENGANVQSAYIGTQSGAFVLAVETNLAAKSDILDPRTRGWYIEAKEANDIIWTDVYDDQHGRGLAITCAAPFYNGAGEIKGVVGIGSLLTNLNDIIVGTKIGDTGYAFVLNDKGQMIISPTIKKDESGKIIRENLLVSENESLREAAKKMVAGGSGIEKVTVDGKEYYMAFEPFKALPWSIATLITVEEALRPATMSETNIIGLKDTALSNRNFAILILIIVLLFVLAILIPVVIYFSRNAAKRLTSPIINLTNDASIIGQGNFSKKLTANTGDEIETLAGAFNSMIDNIQTITADKERISAELNVANNIQHSMLPCIFPAFPERKEFDIYATMLPAKEVGGDFYDFFLVDEDHLGIVMADVSGKGVPAALFMVITKTLIKNYAQLGISPSEVFTRANNQLCDGNDAGMFVTAFMGILNIKTGEFKYVNAGHNPPCIKKVSGEFEFMRAPAGFVLAGMEGIKYKENSTVFEKGDTIFLYTDGVTEATDINNELFSDPRLTEVLNKYKDEDLKSILTGIKAEIDLFVGKAPQFDDITMLGLTYKGE